MSRLKQVNFGVGNPSFLVFCVEICTDVVLVLRHRKWSWYQCLGRSWQGFCAGAINCFHLGVAIDIGLILKLEYIICFCEGIEKNLVFSSRAEICLVSWFWVMDYKRLCFVGACWNGRVFGVTWFFVGAETGTDAFRAPVRARHFLVLVWASKWTWFLCRL